MITQDLTNIPVRYFSILNRLKSQPYFIFVSGTIEDPSPTLGGPSISMLNNISSVDISNGTACLIIPPEFFAFKIYSRLYNSPALRV